jgi:methionyl-tRNA formyltransferase
VIGRLAAGPVSGTKQDKTLVTKAPKLTKEHGLIDWARPASAVRNQIRAMQPWPTAYTFYHHVADQAPQRIIVYRAAVSDLEHPAHVACGAILNVPGARGKFLVATGEGTLIELLEVQPAGKRRMPASEFLRGHPIRDGDRLGAGDDWLVT